ncbi:Uncharacterized protein APZ42_002452, partial [Daphnia magna]
EPGHRTGRGSGSRCRSHREARRSGRHSSAVRPATHQSRHGPAPSSGWPGGWQTSRRGVAVPRRRPTPREPGQPQCRRACPAARQRATAHPPGSTQHLTKPSAARSRARHWPAHPHGDRTPLQVHLDELRCLDRRWRRRYNAHWHERVGDSGASIMGHRAPPLVDEQGLAASVPGRGAGACPAWRLAWCPPISFGGHHPGWRGRCVQDGFAGRLRRHSRGLQTIQEWSPVQRLAGSSAQAALQRWQASPGHHHQARRCLSEDLADPGRQNPVVNTAHTRSDPISRWAWPSRSARAGRRRSSPWPTRTPAS